MPYRHAHWWLSALFPLIGVAFWPGYWGRLGTAPFALHAHGLTATAWLLLLTVQSWSIHARKPAWHRATGLATFVVLPMFAAAGPLALQGMADRTSLPGLARFVDGVAVAVERGTPLAEVLRAQAQDARDEGRRALMERGGKQVVAMMVPVVFLVLPVTVVFAVYPGLAVLRLGL